LAALLAVHSARHSFAVLPPPAAVPPDAVEAFSFFSFAVAAFSLAVAFGFAALSASRHCAT
jgi:hypothetical protein